MKLLSPGGSQTAQVARGPLDIPLIRLNNAVTRRVAGRNPGGAGIYLLLGSLPGDLRDEGRHLVGLLAREHALRHAAADAVVDRAEDARLDRRRVGGARARRREQIVEIGTDHAIRPRLGQRVTGTAVGHEQVLALLEVRGDLLRRGALGALMRVRPGRDPYP